MLHHGKQIGPTWGVFVSILFGSLLWGLSTVDLFLEPAADTAKELSFTLRPIPSLNSKAETYTSKQNLTMQDIAKKHPYLKYRYPPTIAFLVSLGFLIFGAMLFYTHHLRSCSKKGRALRGQFLIFGSLLLFWILAKSLLVFTSISVYYLPLNAFIIAIATHFDRRVAVSTAIFGSFSLGLLNPIDYQLMIVFSVQALIVCGIADHSKKSNLKSVSMSILATFVGLLGYLSLCIIMNRPFLPQPPPQWTVESILSTDLFGVVFAPLVAPFIAILVIPLLGKAIGNITHADLSELANFEHPLLRRLSTKAPGTWAHSVNMANMAEMAANSIGANGQLVRVGAYFHDLGKSVEPKYFIENQRGKNIHDELSPDASADAIFSHVDQGVELARRYDVPEAIVEFIYTHHGRDRLEYFWHKNVKLGNPKQFNERDFSYRGLPPRTKETAILAICDAVEAASRTLEAPSSDDIKALVRRIISMKMEKGILDDSELTLYDLRKIHASLSQSVQSSMHARVKYPWQDDNKNESTSKQPQKSDRELETRNEERFQTSSREESSAVAIPVKKSPRLAKPSGAVDPAWVDTLNEEKNDTHKAQEKNT